MRLAARVPLLVTWLLMRALCVLLRPTHPFKRNTPTFKDWLRYATLENWMLGALLLYSLSMALIVLTLHYVGA